jgi:hypothetical protein
MTQGLRGPSEDHGTGQIPWIICHMNDTAMRAMKAA